MDAKNMDFTLEELKILAENGQKDLQYAVGFYYEKLELGMVAYACVSSSPESRQGISSLRPAWVVE